MPVGSFAAAAVLDGLDPCRIFARNGLAPYDYQVPILRQRPHRGLVAWGRQSGKSSAISALVLDEVFYRAPSLVVVSSFAERQSKELLLKAMDLYQPFADEFPLVVDSKSEKVFRNRSRIVALPGTADSARSFSGVALVILDEAALPAEKPTQTDELRVAIDPLLSTLDGDLIAMSTPPEIADGWWWRTWTQNGRFGGEDAVEGAKDDGWIRTFVPSTRCPSISPEFLAATRADFERMGKLRQFEREYLCRFPETKGDSTNPRLFTPDVLDRIFGGLAQAPGVTEAGGNGDMPGARG